MIALKDYMLFISLLNHFTILKYGEKYREISLQKMTTEDRDRRKSLLIMMEDASRKLDWLPVMVTWK